MNVNGMVDMIVRLVMRRVIGKGVNAGIDMATRKMSGGGTQPPATPNDPASRNQAAQGKEVARRAQQMAKLGRRLGRF